MKIHWADGQPPAAIALDACDGVILVAAADGALFSCGRGVALGLPLKHGTAQLTRLAGLPPVVAFSVGSLSGACAGRNQGGGGGGGGRGGSSGGGGLWTWGDGLSGNLGSGGRKSVAQPTLVELPGAATAVVVHVSCTRGQPRPKRLNGHGKQGECSNSQTRGEQWWVKGQQC